jgi:hypothetical protein
VLKRDLIRRPRTILSHIRCRSTCRTLSKSFWIEEKTNLWTCSTNSKDTGLLIDFNHSFNTTLKGEHILLREYAFVSATALNRKCFL